MKTLEQRDRVNVSLSESEKEYGNGYQLSISYSTDVGEDETPQKAVNRAFRFVDKQMKLKLEKVRDE